MDLKQFFKQNGYYADRTKPYWRWEQAGLNEVLHQTMTAFSYKRPKIRFLLWCVDKWVDYREGIFADVIVGFCKSFGITTVEDFISFDADSVDKDKLLNFINDQLRDIKSLKTATANQVKAAIEGSDFVFEDIPEWNLLQTDYEIITKDLFYNIISRIPIRILYRLVDDPNGKSIAQIFKDYLTVKNLEKLTIGYCTVNGYDSGMSLLGCAEFNIVGFADKSVIMYDPDRDKVFYPGDALHPFSQLTYQKIASVTM